MGGNRQKGRHQKQRITGWQRPGLELLYTTDSASNSMQASRERPMRAGRLLKARILAVNQAARFACIKALIAASVSLPSPVAAEAARA
jgi:hypothetical protein